MVNRCSKKKQIKQIANYAARAGRTEAAEKVKADHK